MTDFKDYWTVDEFLKEYRERLEEKELQLAECLAVKFGTKGFVDDEETIRERERCENELFEVKNKEWLVRYEYTTEEKNEFIKVTDGNTTEFKRCFFPSEKLARQRWEKASEIYRMSREGFPSICEVEPSEIMVFLDIKKYSSEAST